MEIITQPDIDDTDHILIGICERLGLEPPAFMASRNLSNLSSQIAEQRVKIAKMKLKKAQARFDKLEEDLMEIIMEPDGADADLMLIEICNRLGIGAPKFVDQ